MLVKSARAHDHVKHLGECFRILEKYGMKLNPAKCTFAVTSGEFLGYVVNQRGIEANPKQIWAILNLPSPTSSKEIQRLTGRIAALNRFISRSTDKCLPFYQLVRSNKKFEWDEKCEDAFKQFERVSHYPTNSRETRRRRDPILIYRNIKHGGKRSPCPRRSRRAAASLLRQQNPQ
ncbi:unnamed protein product [Microthlaspi erraticum]|uniref:Reverse transcriptase domain-containing protein n=1 Tax=Microthlaspi erraticum TaxID=1685480 RepID=A0A6D2I133_9BRAS|nr:unnamed protein product [Microthlaspi erraticum]